MHVIFSLELLTQILWIERWGLRAPKAWIWVFAILIRTIDRTKLFVRADYYAALWDNCSPTLVHDSMSHHVTMIGDAASLNVAFDPPGKGGGGALVVWATVGSSLGAWCLKLAFEREIWQRDASSCVWHPPSDVCSGEAPINEGDTVWS